MMLPLSALSKDSLNMLVDETARLSLDGEGKTRSQLVSECQADLDQVKRLFIDCDDSSAHTIFGATVGYAQELLPIREALTYAFGQAFVWGWRARDRMAENAELERQFSGSGGDLVNAVCEVCRDLIDRVDRGRRELGVAQSMYPEERRLRVLLHQLFEMEAPR